MKQMIRCERGSVLIILAISLMVLFLAGAAAVDMARFQTARAKFSTCVDNAGLAALAKISTVPPASAQAFAVSTANNYYQANCQAGLGSTTPVTITSSNLTLAADSNSVTINIAATIPTLMMNVVGIKTLTLQAYSVVARSNNNGLELVMVLDNTGSMQLYPNAAQGIPSGSPGSCTNSTTGTAYNSVQGSRMCALQVAAEDLINVLFGAGNATAPPNMWIGVVPFAQAVNIGGADPTCCGATSSVTSPSYSQNFNIPLTGMYSMFGSVPPNTDFGPVNGVSATSANCPSTDSHGNALISTTSSSCTYASANATFALQNWYGCVGQRYAWNSSWWGWSDTLDANPQWGPNFTFYMAPAMETFTQSATGAPAGAPVFTPLSPPLTFTWTADTPSGGYPSGYPSNDETPAGPWPQGSQGGGLDELFPQTTPSPVTGETYPELTPAYAAGLANNWKSVSGGQTTYYLPLSNVAPTGSTLSPQGPNAYCTSPITPMTNVRTTLMTALNNMYPNGQTVLAAGMNWGMLMLSPQMYGVWGGTMGANHLPKSTAQWNCCGGSPPSDPIDNGDIKAVVFMTDGYDFFFPGSYTAYGSLADGELIGSNSYFSTYQNPIYDQGGADAELDSRFWDNCSRLNWYGVEVYTIGFGQTDNVNVMAPPGTPPDVNGPLLQSCASSSANYFFANDAATLNQDFLQIAQLLSNLRVAQ